MKALISLSLCILSINTFSQITMTPETLEQTIDSDVSEYVFDIYVTNTSSTDINFWWKIFREENTPSEWELFVCDFQLCYSPSVVACPPSMPNNMLADTTLNFTFHLKSNEYLGSAKIWLELYSDNTYQTLFDRTDSLGVVTVSSTSSVNDEELQFSLFPNPVLDRLFVDLENFENKELKIYSADGKLKMNADLITTDGLDVSSLQNGIYILTLTDKLSKNVNSHKFVKSN